MKHIAVILAGGNGCRFGEEIPKQFMLLDGRPVLCHSVEAFERNRHIDEILLVIPREEQSRVSKLMTGYGWKKTGKVLFGGKERYESAWTAINALGKEECNLIFHDAARPLVSQRIIDEVVGALRQYEAVGVALPLVDTLWEVVEGEVKGIPDRNRYRSAQTPQAFRGGLIRTAYERFFKDPSFKATDDCGMLAHYLPEVPIHTVSGEAFNMKLTYPEDLEILELFLQRRRH